MRPIPRLVAAAAAFGLLAAACSDDDTTTDAGTDPITEEMSDEEMTDEEMSDEEMSDEEMSDEEMSDEEMMDSEHTFRVTLTNTSGGFPIAASGAQAVPLDGTEPGPAVPGSGYEFRVPRSGERLSFASMFVQTNDWFWSFGPDGLALVDDAGVPVSGDVTDQVSLWDAGTEADQTPGEGADQAPRQSGPNTGEADADATVRAVDGFDAAGYLTVTLSPDDDGSTVVRIDNISDSAAVPGPIAPVAWAVHSPEVGLFTPGDAAPAGLEMLAEDGGPGELVDSLAPLTGTATPFAPIAWTVADEGGVLFTTGEAASAGLEMLAEDGGPGTLVDELTAAGLANSGAATNPDGGDEAGPALPGSTYTFEFTSADAYLSLATMFVQSNDWFVALTDLALYGDDGAPVSGDVSDQLRLYDAGTEADQPIGAGPDQAPRQAGPDTGAADEDATIRGLDVDLAGHLTVEIEVI